jgi:hypothetical protein
MRSLGRPFELHHRRLRPDLGQVAGSAHDEAESAALKAAARQRLVEGQGEFDLGLDSTGIAGVPMEIVSSRAGHLWDALCRAYELVGLDHAAGGDEAFRDLVLARIIEPTSKQDSLRVLAEAGVEPVSYLTVTRRLHVQTRPAGPTGLQPQA